MAPPPDRPPDAPLPACPCGHDNVPAEVAGHHPLLQRAASGDREAFAQLYDTQVDGIYRYLLAWSGDPAAAATLTGEVFSGAFSWLAVTHITDTEAAAWLTAMARDAVVQRRGPVASSDSPDIGGSGGPAAATLAAVARLSDPRREVVVLRLLCGHSLDHTAHLSGFTRRAVQELQLSACLAVWELTSGATAPPPREPAAEEFEHHLAHGDPPGTPADLAGPLGVARSLRQAAHTQVAGPDPVLVERLRQSLLTGTPLDPQAVPDPDREPGPLAPQPPVSRAAGSDTPGSRGPQSQAGGNRTPRSRDRQSRTRGTPTPRSRGPRIGRVAQGREWWRRLSTGLVESRLLRRPWLATGMATAGIVAVLTLQAFGDPAPTGACGGRPCPATTTVVVVAAAGSGSLGTPRTTVLQPTTTTTTIAAAPAPPPSAPRSSAATTPPSTRPATTAPRTTAPRPTTTTRATTTTAPATTVATTTTTVAPPPT